jgi:tetratricopeptide (TPR) repeat protein
MKRILCTLLTISTFQFCFSQMAAEDGSILGSLETAIKYYQNEKYYKSINELRKILSDAKNDSIVTAHTYLAFNYTAIGDKADAIKHFKKALSLNPKLDLNLYVTTPRIRGTFDEARKERARESACCSCFFPGIGQIMKGDDGKGKAIIAASAFTLVGTALSWLVMENKHNYYLSLGPDDVGYMDQAYNDYDRWHKITIFGAATFLGVYVYSFVDAILVGKSAQRQDADNSIGLYLNADGESFCIGYTTGL